MGRLSLSRAWEETAAILVREGGLLSAVALALIVLPQVFLAVVGLPIGAQATLPAQLIYIASVLLSFVAQIAINRLAIGPSVTVREAIAQGFMRVVSVFAVLIVLALILAVVAIILAMVLSALGIMILPGAGKPPTPSFVALLIILMGLFFAIFQLSFPIAAVETGNPLRMISRSWQLARHHYLRLLAFVVTVFIGLGLVVIATQFGLGSVIVLFLGKPEPGSLSALVLGLIAGVVQAAFTVVTAAMLARIYVQLAGRGDAQPSVPSSGI